MNRTEGKLGGLPNFFIKHSVSIFITATVVCLALIAYLANYLNPSVIGAWLIVGIMTTLLLSGVALIVILSAVAFDKARNMRLIPDGIQGGIESQDRYVNAAIKIDHLGTRPDASEVKRYFENCEIHGPGSIYIDKSNDLDKCVFHLCDIVVVKDGMKTSTSTSIKNATFDGCLFKNLVVWIDENIAKTLAEKGNVAGKELLSAGSHTDK